jgi:hypothetical protein
VNIHVIEAFQDYVIVIGGLTITYQTTKKLEELAKYIEERINGGKAFILTIDRDGPKVVINPAPGMAIIIMTKDQFDRNRGIQNLVRGAS